MKENYQTTKEVAKLLSISESTVKRYADKGLIRYIRIGNSGHRRYIKKSIEEYILDQNIHASKKMNNGHIQSNNRIGKLIANPHPPHYLMHKYWGRKAHNIVQQYIKHYSTKDDVVLDPFMGSGVTVIEAIKSKRHAIGVDLNPMSVSIVENTISKVNIEHFKENFNLIVEKVNQEYQDIYQTKCPICKSLSVLDCAVWENDELISVRGKCEDHGKFIKRADKFDRESYSKSLEMFEKIPAAQKKLIPTDEIPRYVKRNKKERINELFSIRALNVLSFIKREINKIKDKEVNDLLNFVFTSMLANTSKMLPGDPIKAIYRSGWVISKFWVPTVHAERNAITCFILRFKAILKGKNEIPNLYKYKADIYIADSTTLPIEDNTVDYIFTDPPYGESIAYFSLSHLWNTWLKNKPNFKDEIIIDPYRNKDYQDYAKRIEKAYREMFRVLKDGSYLSFTFHNRDLNIWKAIVYACKISGFEFVSAVLQEQAVSSGTQGINRNNTLHGDFVYTYRKPVNKTEKINSISYHSDGEVFIVNEVYSFLKNYGASSSSELYEFLIPTIINNNAILNKSGRVINLEKLLIRNFNYGFVNGYNKWELKKEVESKANLNVLDLFSGAGGMSSGFSKVGYNIVAAIEFDKRFKETYLYNHPSTKLILEDIRNVSANGDVKNSNYDIKNIFNNHEKECDVIIGGPPCQGFSLAGNRIRKNSGFFTDERNLLFLEYFRMVKALKPKVFIIENVPGILNYNRGKTRKEIKNKFEYLGYNVHTRILCAADYGVPQLRNRAFFIGNNIGLDSSDLFPIPNHAPANYTTVWDAISDFPDVPPGVRIEPFRISNYKNAVSSFQKKMRSNNGDVYNHSSSKPSEKTIEILKQIKQGQGIRDLPKKYHTRSVHSGAYGRMDYSKPSYTLTTRLNTPSVGRITHPIEHRTITPREAARIQSFDDSYRFFGNITSIGMQIGNAVPPLLAFQIAQRISSILKK